MLRLTSDAPELLLTEHLEGPQTILIFWVANLETREIIEDSGGSAAASRCRTQPAPG